MKKLLYLASVLLLLSFVNADTNGIWHEVEDVRPGVFGSDEGLASAYSFINDVAFNRKIYSKIVYDIDDNNYYLNLSGNSVLNTLSVRGQDTDLRYLRKNVANSITSDMIIDNTISEDDINPSEIQIRVSDFCSPGSSIRKINLDGSVLCENVSDADDVVGNEYPLAGTGINVVGRTVKVDTTYIQRRVSSFCNPGFSIRKINADGGVVCEKDDNTVITCPCGTCWSTYCPVLPDGSAYWQICTPGGYVPGGLCAYYSAS